MSTLSLTRYCSTCKQKALTQFWLLAWAYFLSLPQGPTLIHRNGLVGTQRSLRPEVRRKDILPVSWRFCLRLCSHNASWWNKDGLFYLWWDFAAKGLILWDGVIGSICRPWEKGCVSAQDSLTVLVILSLICNSIKVWKYLGRGSLQNVHAKTSVTYKYSYFHIKVYMKEMFVPWGDHKNRSHRLPFPISHRQLTLPGPCLENWVISDSWVCTFWPFIKLIILMWESNYYCWARTRSLGSQTKPSRISQMRASFI